jgi:hypothetical protein
MAAAESLWATHRVWFGPSSSSSPANPAAAGVPPRESAAVLGNDLGSVFKMLYSAAEVGMWQSLEARDQAELSLSLVWDRHLRWFQVFAAESAESADESWSSAAARREAQACMNALQASAGSAWQMICGFTRALHTRLPDRRGGEQRPQQPQPQGGAPGPPNVGSANTAHPTAGQFVDRDNEVPPGLSPPASVPRPSGTYRGGHGDVPFTGPSSFTSAPTVTATGAGSSSFTSASTATANFASTPARASTVHANSTGTTSFIAPNPTPANSTGTTSFNAPNPTPANSTSFKAPNPTPANSTLFNAPNPTTVNSTGPTTTASPTGNPAAPTSTPGPAAAPPAPELSPCAKLAAYAGLTQEFEMLVAALTCSEEMAWELLDSTGGDLELAMHRWFSSPHCANT